MDPGDEGDRAVLIRAEHPDMVDAIDRGEDEMVVGDEPVDPHLHLAMHEVVAAQVWNGDPPEMWETAERLDAAGYERHEVLHMLASVNAAEFWSVEHDGVPFDRDRYLAALDALPGSWETDRLAGDEPWDLDDPDDFDDDDFDDDDFDELDELVAAARDLLDESGPLSAEELCHHLDADLVDIEVVKDEPLVVVLGDGRLASIPALLAGTIFSHRLTDDEAARQTLQFGVDLAPVEPFVCEADHVHLVGGEMVTLSSDIDEVGFARDVVLEGPEGWLDGAAGGDLLGLRVARLGSDSDSGSGPGDELWEDEGLEIVPVTDEVGVPDTLARQLTASFARFGDGDGMPVRTVELICQLAVDAPALTAGVMAPLSTVLERAGFEVRGGYSAPAGTDWETFDRLRQIASVALRHDLSVDESHALVLLCELCRLFRIGTVDELDREVARQTGAMLGSSDVAEAFAEATAASPQETMEFLARSRGMAGSRYGAQLAWAESLVAGRAGALERAEACLQDALVADPHHEEALEDAAWYASDRGDARQAVRFLERLDEDPDEDRTSLLRSYAGGAMGASGAGRNEACPCGSGRKYKHCCLHVRSAAVDHPLPERVRWIWEKLRWWLDRAGREDATLAAALALHGGPPNEYDISFSVDFDIAASLVLFADGAVHDFLDQRGSLLPDDERNLVAQWALTDRSLHEVIDVKAGDGIALRDLRTGDVVEVRERRGSALLAAGDLICAHPVFDGVGHQLIGGILPVPLRLRQPLMELLDDGAGSGELAWMLGATRRPPEICNMEGDPTVVCEATYRCDDPGRTSSQLDAALDREDEGRWGEWTEVDGQRWLRASVRLDGDSLKLWANSEARFERIQDKVTGAVTGLELISEQRTPAAEMIEQRLKSGEKDLPFHGTGGAEQGVPPQAAEAVAVFVRQQEERWVDESVPALHGLTPRQAAADPTRREDLLALLHEFDRMVAPPGAVGFDVARLRALLGLAGE